MEETFSCEICKKYYELPVMLPCGNSICLEHVLDVKFYKCKLCYEEHIIPETGLELNKSLQKVLNLNLHLNQKQKECRDYLKQFELIIDEFYTATSDSQKYLLDYIVDLKEKIDLERGKLLKENKLDMIARVNDYDEKCKRNLINLKTLNETNKSKYEKYIDDFIRYREELRQPKLAHSRLNQMQTETQQKINEIKILIAQSKNEMSLSRYYINILPIQTDLSKSNYHQSATSANLLPNSFSQTNNSNYNTIRTNNTQSSIRKSNSHTSFLKELNQNKQQNKLSKTKNNKKKNSNKSRETPNNFVNSNKNGNEKYNKSKTLHRSMSTLSLKSDQTLIYSEDSKKIILKDYDPYRDMTGKLVKTFPQAHAESVRFIKFIGNKLLASSSQDRLIKLWNMTSSEVELTLKGHEDTVSCIEMFNETILISGSWDSTIKVWDTKTGELLNTLRGHQGSIICFCLNESNDDLISGSSDFTIKIWSNILESNSKPKSNLSGHTSLVRCLKMNFDGRLISGSNDKLIKLWNLDTNVCEKTLYGHSGSVNCLEIIPDEKILSGSTDATIKLWDLETGTCLKTIIELTTVLSLKLITNDYLISGTSGKSIRIWDLNKSKIITELVGHSAYVIGFDLLPNGNLVSCSGDKSIRFWEI